MKKLLCAMLVLASLATISAEAEARSRRVFFPRLQARLNHHSASGNCSTNGSCSTGSCANGACAVNPTASLKVSETPVAPPQLLQPAPPAPPASSAKVTAELSAPPKP